LYNLPDLPDASNYEGFALGGLYFPYCRFLQLSRLSRFCLYLEGDKLPAIANDNIRQTGSSHRAAMLFPAEAERNRLEILHNLVGYFFFEHNSSPHYHFNHYHHRRDRIYI